MMAIVESISAANAVELLSLVWMEVTMASLAAMVWFTVSGTIIMPKASRKLEQDGQPAQKSPRLPFAAEQSSPLQTATKALRQGRLRDAVALVQQLPETLAGHVPASVAPRLLMAAAKASNFDQAMAQLKVLVGKIEPRALEAAVLEAAKNKDISACRQLQALSASMSISKSARTFEALARVHSSDVTALTGLVTEAEAPLAKGFAGAVLEACAALQEVDLALDVFEKAAEADAAALRAIAEKASKGPSSDASAAGTSKDGLALAKEIRSCGKSGNLKGAMKIFDRVGSQVASAALYNSMLEACAECSGLEKAVHYFGEAERTGCADVVSYNIMMKAYLAAGDEASAVRVLGRITEKGLVASQASYHGLLNARVNAARDRSGAWKLVEQMQAAGVPPNLVTCSILLKAKTSSATDVSKIMALADSTSQPMDEVFFASAVEACIRTNSLDLLSKYQAKLARQDSSVALTAPTYGTMIKAYGQVQDIQRVWQLWEEMTTKNVEPTAITLGCMTEALVANGCVADAWKEVQKMWSKESTRPLVNTVIYSNIMKGFARAKDIEKVMALYKEMRAHGLQPNTITYNTILNSFAQGGAMDRVPALLEDMKSANPPVEPDVVTYSTIVKGYCNSGSLDRALELLQELQADGKLQPDEVMYNSLLDGCAREQRPDEALELLEDMKKSGVTPSNYTLSMLVKLMGRCRRLNQAFSLIAKVSQENGFKVNIQVYTCLIQSCFGNRQANKAVALYDQIISEGLLPDEYTYTVLVQGCLKAKLVDKAVQLAKYAHGVGLPQGKSTPPGISDRCLSELVSALGSEEAKALQAELGKCKVGAPRRGGAQGKGSSRR